MRLTITYILIYLFANTIVVHAQSNFDIQYHISTLNGAHILLESKKWYEDYFISQLSTLSIYSISNLSEEEFEVALEEGVAKEETLPVAINRTKYIQPTGIRFDVFKARNSNTYFRSLPDPGAKPGKYSSGPFSRDSLQLVLVRDSLIVFNWSIDDEYKWIDSIRCRKATMTFRCKDYVAWYDPATPVPTGPEQFGGLPGLIVTMSRSGDRVNWKLKKFRSISGAEKIKINEIQTNIAQSPSVDWCEYGQILQKYVEQISKLFGNVDCKTCKTKLKTTYNECFEDCQE